MTDARIKKKNLAFSSDHISRFCINFFGVFFASNLLISTSVKKRLTVSSPWISKERNMRESRGSDAAAATDALKLNSGLQNVSNTCYLNATVQVRSFPALHPSTNNCFFSKCLQLLAVPLVKTLILCQTRKNTCWNHCKLDLVTYLLQYFWGTFLFWFAFLSNDIHLQSR